MHALAQCVLIRMQTKVAGNSVSLALRLSCFSAFTFPLLSPIHPSSCSHPEQQLHIAAASPPPVSNTKMTFTSSTCRKMGKTETEWCGEKRDEEKGGREMWRMEKQEVKKAKKMEEEMEDKW